MSTDDNKLLVRRFYEEVVSTGNVDRVPEFIAPDYVQVYNDERQAVGLEGAREHVLGVHQTYSGFHLEVGRQIAEDDWVATCVMVTGTHSGVWLGMKPTGRQVRMTGVNVDRVVDGRIQEHGGAANLLEGLLEIGAVKIADPVGP